MSAYAGLAGFYDELTRDVDYAAIADYYEKLWDSYGVKPVTVLDLACGTGTLTVELARRGYELIAADASCDMLSVALEKALALRDAVPPLLLNQSMTELDLNDTVSAAVCSLDGINYVPPEELSEVFRRLRLFIAPGGVLIFDINSPYKLKNQDGQVFVDETEDVFCLWRTELSPDGGACNYGMDIFYREGGGWQRFQEEHTEYIHAPEALAELLSEQGFGEIRFFGDKTVTPPGEREMRIFIAARRM